MNKLTDIQLILLTSTSQRPDGSLLPPPENLHAAGKRIHKSVAALLKRGYAMEVEVAKPEGTWREESDRRIGLVITPAGRAAIGLDPAPADDPRLVLRSNDSPDCNEEVSGTPAPEQDAPTSDEAGSVTARVGSKQALLLELLRTQGGVTITDLADATGWLPHTTRAALTGFRKRGLIINKDKADGVTRYSAGAGAQA